jgi:D-3-phosphoglycerate dehydrogenase
MRVYVLDPFFSAGPDLVAQYAETVYWDDPRVANWHQDADGIMVRMSRITCEDISKSRKLKVISKQGVGLDNIDVAAAEARGIVVRNTPGINSEAVAEMSVALGLAVCRRLVEFDRGIRSGEPVQRTKLLGIELWGKTVGVVGMGNIGYRTARKWYRAFETSVIAYDPYASANIWPDIPHQRAASLDELLPQVDLLTLHVPLTSETKHLIGYRELALMKSTAIVVNVSRGGIVHEVALYDALKAGRLFGAGIDVFETEPPTSSNPLATLPTVVVTPHAAGGTRENQERSSLLVARQLLDVLNIG